MFPAYATLGGKSEGNEAAGGRNNPPPPLFVIDRGNVGGSSRDPITVDDDEEGEYRSPRQSPPRPSSATKEDKHHKSSPKKRKRSRSRSPKHKKKKNKRSQSPNRDNNRDRNQGGPSNNGFYQPRQDYSFGNNDWRGDGGRNQGQGQWNQGQGSGYNQQDRFQDRGGGGRNDKDVRVFLENPLYNNNPNKNYQDRERDMGRDQYYENKRLSVAQRFPKKAFLEEVDLKPEFAFRVDSAPTQHNLNFYAMGNQQKSFYQNEGVKVVGASDLELTQIYSKWSKFRCIYPEEIADEAASSQPSISKRPVSKVEVQTFIPLPDKRSKKNRNQKNDNRIDISGAFGGLSFPKKDEPTMKEKIETFNKRVRDEPRNIELWKQFIEFQDAYFGENDQIYDDGEDKVKKKRRNLKALLEKKIAIIDKALETNPKNLDLHLMRLNFLYNLQQPDVVLSEWKKLVNGNQQVTAYWMEYFRFASTQLQVYSTPQITSIIMNSFSKFRQMLSPKFPEFQRPLKLLLVINDISLCLSLVLRNAGYREKAIALHQAQLELDFYAPELKSDSLLEWTENKKAFEFFWDMDTAKFGEKNAAGWASCTKEVEKHTQKNIVGVSDLKLASLEDSFFFEAINQTKSNVPDKTRHWLRIESCRSKLHWLPWRAKCSDAEDYVDDSSRIVLGEHISPCIVAIPNLDFVTEFNKQSAHFRHIVNFLLTLQEDFIPQTHTVSSVMSPFTSISLTESRSLVSELFYWRNLLNLYVPEQDIPSAEKDETPKPLVKTPEGFRVPDWTTPNNSAFKCDFDRKPNSVFELKWDNEKMDTDRNSLLLESESTLLETIRTIVDKGVDLLSPTFATLLFDMYLRFEQKNTVGSQETRKVRIKFAKTLLQKETLRNSTSSYMEVAMLEYFEGNRDNAINLIVKTINLTCINLIEVDEMTGFVNVEKNWEIVTELTKLYIRLAEFNLNGNSKMAYNILILLGSGFKPVDLQANVESISNNEMLKALRNFEKVLSKLMPVFDSAENDGNEVFKMSNEMLGQWGGDKCVDYFAQKSNLIVEWTKAFALFQFLAKEQDFSAACHIYEKVLARIEILEPLQQSGNYDDNVVIRHHICEQLYINWCNLGAHVLTKDPMANSKFRIILGQGLQKFPSSPPLLLLFTDVEKQMSIAGKLWRMMVGVVKQDGGCNQWAPLIMGMRLAKKIEDLEHDEEIGLTSFGLGGPAVPPDTIFYKLDSLLTAAQENRMTRNCPLIWRVHLKLLALRMLQGKDHLRAKSTFYEGVRQCPSAKTLYLDGVLYFPEMFKEITDLMTEKHLYTRLPVEELDVLLEIEDKPKDLITISSDDE